MPIPQTNVGRMRCSFYGLPGTGKTRLACTFPKPLLLVAPEVGTDSIVGTPGVDVAPVEATSDIWTLIEHATTGRSCWGAKGSGLTHLGVGQFKGEKYRTVVLDTATKYRSIRIKELFAAMGKEVPRSQPFLYADKQWKDVWTQTSYDLKKMLEIFLDVPRVFDMNVIVNSHEANLTHDEGGGGSEFLRPNIASAIGKSVSEFLNAESSYVGQLAIREKTATEMVQQGDLPPVPVSKRVGAEYVMRVGPDSVYRTKFRRAVTVTSPLPDFIVDPTYEKIVKLIRGEKV